MCMQFISKFLVNLFVIFSLSAFNHSLAFIKRESQDHSHFHFTRPSKLEKESLFLNPLFLAKVKESRLSHHLCCDHAMLAFPSNSNITLHCSVFTVCLARWWMNYACSCCLKCIYWNELSRFFWKPHMQFMYVNF